MNSPESHIGPEVRKELCGRLVYFDNIQPIKDNFHESHIASSFDALRDSLFEVFIKEELSACRNGSGTDSFLARLVSRIGRAAKPQFENHPALLLELKSTLEKRVLETSCTNCNSLELGSNSAIVGAAGCCITSLRQMFDLASEAAHIYYSEFATNRPRTLPRLVFSTKHVRERSSLHDLPISYAITGSTRPHESSKQYWSEISIKFCVCEFDFDSYMAVPYVLFHECIAHGFQGVMPNCRNREASEPEDGFTEGWMDYVAFKVMEEIIEGKGPAKHFGLGAMLTEEHRQRASSFYSSRINLEVRPPSRPSQYAPYRKAGNNAANRVYHVLRRLPESQDDPWRAFLKMSFDLNMLQSFASLQRNQFIALLNNLARPGHLESERHCEIVWILRKYLQNNDINRLIDDIIGLRQLWIPLRPETGPLPANEPLSGFRFSNRIL